MGRPAINTVFNHGEEKNMFNAGAPVNDWRDFGTSFVNTLTSTGAANPSGLAHFLLPDILTLDTASSSGFPNGRQLSDDVIDTELNLITGGAVTWLSQWRHGEGYSCSDNTRSSQLSASWYRVGLFSGV